MEVDIEITEEMVRAAIEKECEEWEEMEEGLKLTKYGIGKTGLRVGVLQRLAEGLELPFDEDLDYPDFDDERVVALDERLDGFESLFKRGCG
jgi:hypothetical protein